jgi:glycosyltransferase involved in cell wall biosynthesis
MSRPVLTIAVPTYNRAALLDLCLGRIIEQVRPYGAMVEVLVSNNAATDHTKDVIAKYQTAHPSLRYSENERNAGPDYNIAKCFELAAAPYVWVFSDDDLLLPNAIDRILPLLQAHDLGIVTLATNFYRHSIHEWTHSDGPLAYALYDDPHELARETHFWLTYITGIITNKDAVRDAKTLYHYQKTFLVQLGWVIPALFSRKPSAKVSTPLILGRSLEVMDFKLFHVFGTKYPEVLEGLTRQGALPTATKEMLIELIIARYFPHYIQPHSRYSHGEQSFPILARAFWNRKSFWTKLVPLFARRRLLRLLDKARVTFAKTTRCIRPLGKPASRRAGQGHGSS